MEKILQVQNVKISFKTDHGKVKAVRGVSFDLYKGEALCIVGESGSGKSVTSKAIMGILANNSIIEGGKVNNMTSEDILKIVNLKHAWEFILNKNVILSDTNFALLCAINKMVEEGFYYTAGKVRNTPVTIGGTTWKPDLPIESVIKEE